MENTATTTNDIRRQPTGGNFLLKACIFATGLAGIVAEYVMATLASYLLGDAVLQWTLTVSIMLFAMGVGSRVSQYIKGHLLDALVTVELVLSLLCAVSAIAIYLLSAYVSYIAPFIYGLSFCIGLLIGIEIPLATRLNDVFEELRVNISSVMEKDYYGALLGGLVFAYFALPYLGLTYTPIVLGVINFSVAAALFIRQRAIIHHRRRLTVAFLTVPLLLGGLFAGARPVILYGEQQKYVDKVIYEEQTPYQRIVMTQWKDHYWLYLNGSEQFSSFDEERYHEPLVHPAMQVSVARRNVLVLGGGDGLATRELLKYDELAQVTLVDLDPAVTTLGSSHPVFLKLNEDALRNPRVTVINQDAYLFLKESAAIFDVIIIDLPDPKTVGLARLYSLEFYQLARRHLSVGGALVTQATSPFFSRQAFLSILKTLRAAGFAAVPYRNHIPTMGEWGWVLGMNSDRFSDSDLKKRLLALKFDHLPTRYLNHDAVISMLHFGKNEVEPLDDIEVNNEITLSTYQYYKNGQWDLY